MIIVPREIVMSAERSPRQWSVLGVIDITAPGRYEILYSNEQGVAVRQIPAEDNDGALVTMTLGDTGILHTCTRCSCCGSCACQGKRDHCPGCEDYRRWARQAEPELEAYRAASAEPKDWFVATGSGIVHAAGCSSLASTVRTVTRVLEEGCRHTQYWDLQCPAPVRADQIRSGRRCRTCCPDITVPT